MFPGTKIVIEGQTYTIPALSLGQLRSGLLIRLREHDKLLSDRLVFDAMLLRGEIILVALQRNHPDVTQGQIDSVLDLRTTGDIWLTVLGSSGFSPGEDQAAATTANGTSAPSTEV